LRGSGESIGELVAGFGVSPTTVYRVLRQDAPEPDEPIALPL